MSEQEQETAMYDQPDNGDHIDVSEDDLRAEAERRYPSNHTVDFPFDATGEAWSDEYGYEEYARSAFIAGAEWQASRKVVPTDKMVTRAWRTYHIAIWGDDLDPAARGSSRDREAMRAALYAAQ